jgi:prepilin-type N-terminal cleavage/methylation domain-containing protein
MALEMRRGFTLIELSIVLVIIALIVGGVMVGKDLIRAAQLRGTISQYEQFNTAVNTFKLKYTGLPGDLERSKAVAFGFPYTYASHPTNNGNGMVIDSEVSRPPPDSSSWRASGTGEVLYFWRYLSVDTKLLPGSYGAYFPAGFSSADPMSGVPVDSFPNAKIALGASWVVGSNRQDNFYAIAAMDSFWAGYYHNPTWRLALTPSQAYAIDLKVDNGLPNTGMIQARGTNMFMSYNGFELTADLSATNAAPYAATPVAGTCTTGGASSTDTTNIYATASVSGDVGACNLRLKFN